MGLLSKLFRRQDADSRKEVQQNPSSPQVPEKAYATVELKSLSLLVFDLPGVGATYTIPDFVPGKYRIPLEAIVKADDSEKSEQGLIEVDTGVIYFIDAEFEENFRQYETQLFEDTGDSNELVENPEEHSEHVGIRYDCLHAPGVGSGYAFEGDGEYILDISRVEKV